MKRILFLVFLPVLLLSQCTTPETETEKYAWNIDISNGEYNQPVSAVALLVNGKKIEIMNHVDAPMENISQQQFKTKGVPDSALLACGGFWAGFEQVLYVQRNKNELECILMTFEEGFAEPQTIPIKTIESNSLN